MQMVAGKSARTAQARLCMVALALMLGLGGALSGASADETDARNLFKAMSDYMGAQKALSFQYDTDIEIVTKDKQKLGLASSGTVTLNRPDKIRITRTGGFADVEFLFDGKTLTLFGKTTNLYGQLEVPGTIDHLIDELRDKWVEPNKGTQSFTAFSNVMFDNELRRRCVPQMLRETRRNPRAANRLTY